MFANVCLFKRMLNAAVKRATAFHSFYSLRLFFYSLDYFEICFYLIRVQRAFT